ncbi:hypothetical protein ACWDSJ_29670 [Nocardia sp. NPDC003482]
MTTHTDPATVAADVLHLLRAERFDELATRFAPRLAAAVSPDTTRLAWTTEIAKIGGIDTVGPAATERLDTELTRVRVPVTGTRGGLEVRMSVDAAGLLHGLQLAPPRDSLWAPPDYARPRRFTEREVTLEAESCSVPGTLTMPKGHGPRAAVVLVSSGPMDCDLTSGPNKPFKDLAWGLASRGIAVLRFDKVTFVHPELNSRDGFTMLEEYLPTTIAAVRMLREEPGVDPARVYVAGHSGGGKAAPRIAAAEPSIAGVVILAGDTVPMPRAALRVYDYLARLRPEQDAAEVRAAVARAAASTESPDLSPTTPAADLLFGLPASYWLDLRAYDPVATASTLNGPILILQGGRDYQVTVADDLPAWRAGLAARPDVTIRVHDRDDHLFFPGDGLSTPADYEKPAHVDAAVIDDIADWLAPTRERGPIARRWRLVQHSA